MKKNNIFAKLLNFFTRPNVLFIGFLAVFEIVHVGVLFGNGDLLAGGDNYSYLQLGRTEINPYVWDNSLSLGGRNYAIANILGIPLYSLISKILPFISGPILQRVLIFLLYFFKDIAFVKLALLFKKRFSWFCLLPVILLFGFNAFESLNPFPLFPLMYAVYLPLSLYFFIKLFESEKFDFPDISKLIILSLIFSPLNSNMVLSITVFIPQFLYLFLSIRSLTKTRFFNLLAFYFLLVFSSLWWLLPMFSYFLGFAAEIFKNGWFSSINVGNLYSNFRFIGQWGWYGEHYLYPYYPFSKYYDNPLVIFSTYLVVILAFLGGLKNDPDIRTKKFRNFFLLLSLVSLFLISGSRPPLGFFYDFLYRHLPGFQSFREPFTKFGELYVLSVCVLFYFFLCDLEKYFSARRKIVVFLFILFLIIINVKPVLLGEHLWSKWNGSMRTFRVKIPSYWEDFENYVKANIKDSRILAVPKIFYGSAWNWVDGFTSADDVAVNFVHDGNSILRNPLPVVSGTGAMIDNIFKEVSLPKSYLSLLGVNYVLQENDFDWRYSGGPVFSPTQSNEFIQFLGLKKVNEFGKFTPEYLSEIPNDEPIESLHDNFYSELLDKPSLVMNKLDDKYFLPYFYIPKNLIYSNGTLADIPNIVSFEDMDIRLMIFFPSLIKNNDGKKNISHVDEELKNLTDKAGDIFVRTEFDNPISNGEVGNFSWETRNISFPYARWKPGSPLYFLVLKKEELDKWAKRKWPSELFEKQIFYAAKRVSEIEKWSKEMSEEERKLSLTAYGKETEKAFAILEQQIAKGEDVSYSLKRIEKFLVMSKEKIEEVFIGKWGSQVVGGVFDRLKGMLKQLKPQSDLLRLGYNFEVLQKGEYDVFIKDLDIKGLKNWEILGEKIGTDSAKQKDNSWTKLGRKNLEVGGQKIILNLFEPENLVGDNWQSLQTATSKDGKIDFNPQNFFSTEQFVDLKKMEGKTQLSIPNHSSFESEIVFQPIKNYHPDTIYHISFEYLATYGRGKMIIVQNSDIDEKTGEISPLIQKELPETKNGQWSKAELFIKSDLKSNAASLYFFAYPEGKTIANIQFKNVKVEEVLKPTLILRDARKSVPEIQIPKITFIKINPTKYKVKVENALAPYSLVFSESFDSGWKAYVNKIQNSKFKIQNNYSEIMNSYFDGEIKEGVSRNIFFDRNTFETWNKKPIPESRHLLVNGYANSWYIKPEDAENNPNYEIIIEFQPQRAFYLWLGVSLSVFLLCFGCLGYNFLKRRK